jgi:RNA polymerase sigma-70 factor (ECF subfamily)
LTRSPWDAEDVVQEAVARAFARLGDRRQGLEDPLAYLLRTASNVWIDQTRRAARSAVYAASAENGPQTRSRAADREVRESMGTLATALPPQERAAVVLKDVLDLSVDETAALLGTTANAVKAALHRGRGRLDDLDAAAAGRPAPSPRLVDAFVAAFNARDTKALASMLLEHATADVVGFVDERGRDEILRGSIHHTLVLEPGQPRAEVRSLLGEPVVLVWYADPQGSSKVEDVIRLDAQVDESGHERVAAIRYHYFCPEVLAEVGAALGVPVSTNGYQH